MYAECLAHENKLTDATKALEDIMKTRQPSYACAATTKAELLEEINYQKRVEFWGEGIEFTDNRRLNIPVDRTSTDPHNNHLDKKTKVNQEAENFLYQIPVSEIENNKKINEEDQD